MSLQWTFIAGFLYAEIVACVLLCLPFISCKRWHYILSSRLFALLVSYGNLTFMVLISILCLLFADAVREVRKYSLPDPQQVNLSNNPNAQDHVLMLLFRAQRNLYISGFALFLWLVLRRLVLLITNTAKLEANVAATQAQAESASRMAQDLLDKENDDSKDDTEDIKDLKARVQQLKDQLSKALQESNSAKADMEAMKSQAKATGEEYDRLMEEHRKLQEQLGDGEGDKKDK